MKVGSELQIEDRELKVRGNKIKLVLVNQKTGVEYGHHLCLGIDCSKSPSVCQLPAINDLTERQPHPVPQGDKADCNARKDNNKYQSLKVFQIRIFVEPLSDLFRSSLSNLIKFLSKLYATGLIKFRNKYGALSRRVI